MQYRNLVLEKSSRLRKDKRPFARIVWLVIALALTGLIAATSYAWEDNQPAPAAHAQASFTAPSTIPLLQPPVTASSAPPIDCHTNPFGNTLELFTENEVFVGYTSLFGGPPRVSAEYADQVYNTVYNIDVIQGTGVYEDSSTPLAQNLSAQTTTAADLNGDGQTEFIQSFVNGSGKFYAAKHAPNGTVTYHLLSNEAHSFLSAAAGNILGGTDEKEQAVFAATRDRNGALEILVFENGQGGNLVLAGMWKSNQAPFQNSTLVDVAVGNFNNNEQDDIVVSMWDGAGNIRLLVLEYDATYSAGAGDNLKYHLKEIGGNTVGSRTPKDVQVIALHLTADFQDEIVVAFENYSPSSPGVSPNTLVRTFTFDVDQNSLVQIPDLHWEIDAYSTNFALTKGDVNGNGREEIILGFGTTGSYVEGEGITIQTLEAKNLNTPNPSLGVYKGWFNYVPNERTQAEYLSLAARDLDNDGKADIVGALDDGRGLELIWLTDAILGTSTLPYGHSINLDPTLLNAKTSVVMADRDNDSIKADYQGQCLEVNEKALTSVVFIPPYWRNMQEAQPFKGGAIGESRSQTEGEEAALSYDRSHSTSAYVGVGVNTDVLEISAKATAGEEYTTSSLQSSAVYTTETTTVQRVGGTDFAVFENTTYYCFGYQLEQAGVPITGTIRNCEYIDSSQNNTDLDVWDGTRGLHAQSISEAMSWTPVARDWASLALFRGPFTVQSSTASGKDAARAVDGNLSGDPADNSLATTLQQNNPWWQVDLGENQPISKIRVWNHADPAVAGCLDTTLCPSRLSDFYVFVSATDFTTIPGADDPNVLLAQPDVYAYSLANLSNILSATLTTAAPAGRVTTFLTLDQPNPSQPPVPIQGRYVRVHLARNNAILSLAEVQVFGTNHVDPDRYPRDVKDDVADDGFFEVELFNPHATIPANKWQWVSVRGNVQWSGVRDENNNPRFPEILAGEAIGLGDSSWLQWSFNSENVRSEIESTTLSHSTSVGFELDAAAGYVAQIQAGYGEEWSFGTTTENTHTASWGQAFEVGGEMQGFPSHAYNGQAWVDVCNYQMRPYLYEITEESSFGGVHRYPVLDYVVPEGSSPNNLDRDQDLANCRNGNQTGHTPQAAPDAATMTTGGTINLSVLGNDVGNNLQITNVSTPAHGTATIMQRAIVYTPNSGFTGEDTFSYTMSDGVTTSQGTVTVTVERQYIYLPLIVR